MRFRLTSQALIALLTMMFAGALVACGSDDEEKSSAGAPEAGKTEKIEQAFLTGMVHHHETAIEMSEIAEQRSKDPYIKKLAGQIKATQEREMEDMRMIHKRLLGSELRPDPGGHDGLGLNAQEAGMTHDAGTNQKLAAANPFDRAFVDEMVPHHEGALKMAEVVLAHTKDPELRKLAENIVTTQVAEVKGMNAFRTREFGGPVPKQAGHGGGEKPAGEEHGAGHSG